LKKKIGGDFEYTDYGDSENGNLLDYLNTKFLFIEYFLSGRSAIYSLIKYLVEKENIGHIYLPAYLCESIYIGIISAIANSDIKVIFYFQDKNLRSELNEFLDNSIIFIIDYFGTTDDALLNQILNLKAKFLNIVIIKDITHSLFNCKLYSIVDYYLGSLRKWFFLPDGAFLASNNKELPKSFNSPDENLPLVKVSSSIIKKLNSIYDPKIFKEEYYLSIQEFYEQKLNEFLDSYKPSKISLNLLNKVDVNYIIERRKYNRDCLINLIGNFKKITILNFTSVFTLPILLKRKKDRDFLREELKKRDIFLPVHWPTDWQKSIDKNLYNYNKKIADHIISLVIDQRYNENDMIYMAENIKEILGEI